MRKPLFLVVPLLLLAGCAGPAKSPGVATANGGATPSASAAAGGSDKGDGLKFAQCMRDNGITGFEDPDPDAKGVRIGIPEGVTKDTADKAMEACKKYLPNGGQPGKVDPAITAKLRELAKCMRANGVPEFPDPNADGGLAIKSNAGDNLDPHSEVFQKADAACKQFHPDPQDGPGEQKHEENG